MKRRYKTTKKPQEPYNWLLAIAQKAKKDNARGPKDLSSNMDKYMYGEK